MAKDSQVSVVSLDADLPVYADPPVDETVLAIQFASIPGFGIPHYGLFWSRVRADYPYYEIQSPIPSVTEQSTPTFGRLQVGLQFVTAPEVRCWFLDKTRNELLQLQDNRFMRNWRRIAGDEPYPHYPALRESFKKEWLKFSEFLEGEKLETPQVNQCEITYVNHIEYGKGWDGYGELHKVISTWASSTKKPFLPSPERVSMEVQYRWGDDTGRLRVSLQPVIRGRDRKEVLQLTLVARGAPKAPDDESVFQCLDHCRRWVVKGFADFTTDTIQKEVWGRKK